MDVCLVDALRSLGVPLQYRCDGPFWALADGNAWLRPYGFLDVIVCVQIMWGKLNRPRLQLRRLEGSFIDIAPGKYVVYAARHFVGFEQWGDGECILRTTCRKHVGVRFASLPKPELLEGIEAIFVLEPSGVTPARHTHDVQGGGQQEVCKDTGCELHGFMVQHTGDHVRYQPWTMGGAATTCFLTPYNAAAWVYYTYVKESALLSEVLGLAERLPSHVCAEFLFLVSKKQTNLTNFASYLYMKGLLSLRGHTDEDNVWVDVCRLTKILATGRLGCRPTLESCFPAGGIRQVIWETCGMDFGVVPWRLISRPSSALREAGPVCEFLLSVR